MIPIEQKHNQNNKDCHLNSASHTPTFAICDVKHCYPCSCQPTVGEGKECDCNQKQGTTNQTGHFNDCLLSSPTPESKEEKSLCCGRPWAKSVSNTKGTRKICSNCGTPHSETDALLKAKVSPTPDVGEEWPWEESLQVEILEPMFFHLKMLHMAKNQGEAMEEIRQDVGALKSFISNLLSQREARVRGEAYRDGTHQGEFDARVRLEAELVESIRLKARQETIAECVEALKAKGEEAVKGLWYITEDQFEALQSLSPNQK